MQSRWEVYFTVITHRTNKQKKLSSKNCLTTEANHILQKGIIQLCKVNTLPKYSVLTSEYFFSNAPTSHTPPVVVPAPLSISLSLIMLFQIGGSWYYPPSLLRSGAFRMCITSFTPLSNHLCSTDSILVFSNVIVWLGLSVCMCFETSDVVELGLQCSPNLAVSERSVISNTIQSIFLC